MENFPLSPDALLLGAVAFAMVLLYPRLRALMGGNNQFISVKDLKAMLDKDPDTTVLDVRTPKEFTGPLGHIANSGNLPLDELQERLGEVGEQLAEHKSETVVVVCRTHNRSPKAAEMLRRVGFTDIKVLKGGLTQWNQAGLPVEGATPETDS
jgi:rhodanese-related sulfurtransferase